MGALFFIVGMGVPFGITPSVKLAHAGPCQTHFHTVKDSCGVHGEIPHATISRIRVECDLIREVVGLVHRIHGFDVAVGKPGRTPSSRF